MPEQLSLLGDAPKPTDRLLFAIVPDVETAARIENVAHRLRLERGLSGAPLLMERFHVTLHHIGDYHGLPNGHVEAASRAAAMLAASPFEVTFDRAGSFDSRTSNHPFVLSSGEGAASLNTFRNGLADAMARAKVGRKMTAQFTPHVTLLYDRKCVEPLPIAPIRWTVREFVLLHSLLGQTRHIQLGRWSLKD